MTATSSSYVFSIYYLYNNNWMNSALFVNCVPLFRIAFKESNGACYRHREREREREREHEKPARGQREQGRIDNR